jgi:hypothetical protein
MDSICSTHGEIINAYKVLVGKPEVKRPLGLRGCLLEDNIKVDLKEIVWEAKDWVSLVQIMDQ